jgi:hypothetical protein
VSSFLAIGAVTALLRDLLNEGLVKQHVVSSTLDADHVGALPPDLIEKETNGKPRLNVFLHRVSPNTGWSNVDFPSFDKRGMRVGTPPLALDLHYLLTAQGSDNLHAEVLLGCAMQLLHETPVFTRTFISRKQVAWASGSDALLKALATAELSDQAEQIKVTPEVMSSEEVSRLWAAFQAHYRPTAAYRVTVVLIESDRARRSTLPVLTLGPDDRGVYVQPNLTPPTPTLYAVTPPHEQPSARLDDDLTLKGHRLDGITLMDEATDSAVDSSITVRFFDPRRQRILEADPQAGGTADRMTVRLRDAREPSAPERIPAKRWAAGTYSVSVQFRRPDGTPGPTTNDLPVSLAPTILLPITIRRDADNKAIFVVRCKPEVRWYQRASLLVGSVEIPAAADVTKAAAEAVAKAAEDEASKQAATKDSTKQAARAKADPIKAAAEAVAKAAEDEAAKSAATKDTVGQAAREEAEEIKAAVEAVAKAAEDEAANNPDANKQSVRDAASAQAGQTDTLTFGPRSIAGGDYFVRLRIDNVESMLIDRTATPPTFDHRQMVRVP